MRFGLRQQTKSWGLRTGLLTAAVLLAVSAASANPPPPPENPKRDPAALRSWATQIKKGVLSTKKIASTTETEHRAHLSTAIAPSRNAKLSVDEAKALKSAAKAIKKGNPDNARALKSQLSNPTARKLIDWLLYRAGDAPVSDIQSFLDANPVWPNRWLLKQRIEEKLFEQNNKRKSLKYFSNHKPETPMGKAALATAHLQNGNKDEATRITKSTWREDKIPSDFEKQFLKRLGHLLSQDDHKWRLDKLMIADIRWNKTRNKRASQIRRQIPRLSASEQKKANARLAAFTRKKGAASRLTKLPTENQTDWGVVFQRAELLRRANKTTQAAKLLLSAPTDKASTVKPDAWWAERRRLAYQALDNKNPKLAYQLVQDAGPLSVNPLKDQQFFAGWLALRYLGDKKNAVKHFTTMAKAADGPLSHSKSNYWLGRAYEAMGQTAEAQEAYQKSAKQIDTFHGHLSRKKLDPSTTSIELTPPQLPTQDQIDRFNSLDAAQAVVIADKAGLGRSITRPFLAYLAQKMKTESEVSLVAHLAQSLGDTQQALRIGKIAIARGMNMIYYAYPVHAFPDYKPLRKPPETAFLLGIARQESEFNTLTLSGAGARGILQVMPITARHVCRDYKIKCQIKRLMTDESYNTKIASAYIADRMGEFGGSYVLGLSGYNAGPGRTRQWIKRFGDPRDGRIDPIDWIERLPFKETRKYVSKVLSNIQIYRARIGQEKNALRITQDLKRAQKRRSGNRALYAPGANIGG